MRTSGKPKRYRASSAGQAGWGITWGRNEASQLVEFAFLLPLLLVLAVGVGDFSSAFVLRDKLTNAAREGARISIGQPTADLTQPNPLTVQAARDAVVNYLNNAGVPATLTGTSPCSAPPGTFSWTYCLSNSGQIRIERQFLVSVGGTLVLSTRVTVSYPYAWSFGRVAGLLGSSTFSNSFTLSSQSVMQNLR